MKRKKLLAVLFFGMAWFLGACGSKDTGEMIYLSDFQAEDYVTLGEYKGLTVDLEEPELSEEVLEGYFNLALTGRVDLTEVTGRSVRLGDTANIDYEGKMDGIAFEGGTAQGYDLTIGSGSFIDGFEDGVIGMKIGETKDIDLNFPDPYKNNPDLAGKPVVFTVTVNSIAVPQVTDEYVVGLALEDCITAEDYRRYAYDILKEQVQSEFESNKVNAALAAAEENAVFKKVPEGMLNRMKETMRENLTSYAAMNGVDIGTYVAYVYGGSAENYEDTILEQAELTVQGCIMMAAIAHAEGIEITDQELEDGIAQQTAGYASYGYDSEEAYRETIDEEAYREFLLMEKVSDFLAENVILGSGDE